MKQGVDVSDWQEYVRWDDVAAAGYEIGICKATEGTYNHQSTFATNRANARAAGLTVGMYHFAQPGKSAAATEAEYFCGVVGTVGARELVVLDIETGNTAQWPAWIYTFCSITRDNLGVTPLVYMSESPAKSMPAAVAEWPLWVAGYQSTQPVVWEDWQVGPWDSPVMWQWTSDGSVPGINGRCDLNIAPDDFYARIGLDAPPAPIPIPPPPFTLGDTMRVTARESNPDTSSYRYDLTLCRQNGASAGNGAKLETAVYITRLHREQDMQTVFDIVGPNITEQRTVSGGGTETYIPTADGAVAVVPVLESEEHRLVVEYDEKIVPS